jgi:hypothetical protein
MCVLNACGRRDHLDGRTPAEAIAELAVDAEVQLPPGHRIVGYRAGWDERFAKLLVPRSSLGELMAQPHMRRLDAMPPHVDGGDPSGITTWWTPRNVTQPTILKGELRRRPGDVIMVIDTSGDDDAVVYVYCLLP